MFNPEPGKNYAKVNLNSMGVTLFTKIFGFVAYDLHTAEKLVDTVGGSLQFKDKYLEITLKYPTHSYFGLGERVTPDFFLCSKRDACYYTLWGKDEASPIDDGSGGCKGDSGVYEKINYMFMIGSSLLIAPVLFLGATSTYPYCTNEDWYDLRTRTQVYSFDSSKTEGSQIIHSGGFDYVSVLVIGGSILPYQNADNVNRIDSLKGLQMELLIVPDHNGNANGTLVLDDGHSRNIILVKILDTIKKKEYTYLKFGFSMDAKKLVVSVFNYYDAKRMYNENVSSITIFGAEELANVRVGCLETRGGYRFQFSAAYDYAKKTLTFYKPNSGTFWSEASTFTIGKSC